MGFFLLTLCLLRFNFADSMRYFLTGFMASGKTYWARQWSQAAGLPMYDLDQEIEKRENKTVDEIFREKGEVYFRKVERDTLRSFLKQDHYIMACGGGTPCFFDNMQRMSRNGVVIYLKATAKEIAERLHSEKESRPLVKDIDDAVLETFVAEKLMQRANCYDRAQYHFPIRYLDLRNFEKIIRRHA